MRNKKEKKEELRREGAFFSSFGYAKKDLGVYLRFFLLLVIVSVSVRLSFSRYFSPWQVTVVLLMTL
jgi:hypothetical protein